MKALYQFDNFGIMADTQNAPFKVFSLSNMVSKARNGFLDPENLYFDTTLTSLGDIMTVLDHFDSIGIMADTHNAPIKVFSSLHIVFTVII